LIGIFIAILIHIIPVLQELSDIEENYNYVCGRALTRRRRVSLSMTHSNKTKIKFKEKG
jgi:hypothetical protein